MGKDQHKPSINFFKERLFIYAVLAVSVITALLLVIYSSLFLTPSFTRLITTTTQSNAINVGRHIETSLFKSGKPFDRQTLPPNFSNKIGQVISNFNLMKVKVFNPDGEAIFSTSPPDIGKKNTHEYFWEVVAKGKPYTKIVHKGKKSLENQTFSMDVVETYVPVMKNGHFMGAFEIYLNITEVKQKLDILVKRANILLYMIGGGLLIFMLLIAAKAAANIKARQRAENQIVEQSMALSETNADLSIINEISAVINQSIDLDRLLPGILNIITSRFAVFDSIHKAGIFLMAGDSMALAAHQGADNDFIKIHHNMTINDCLCGKAAKTGEIIFSSDSDTDKDHTFCCEAGEPHGHVIIPLMANERVVGVLYLYTEPDIKIVGKDDLLRSIGCQIGLAINNANLYQQTKKMALYDQLTGLPNRRALDKRLAEAVSQAKRYNRSLAVGMIDIDFFKQYNDTMGHAAGDKILANVGSKLRNELRDADFAARYGGEEFLIILAETDRCGACIGAERIRKTMDDKVGITISIGITTYREGMTVKDMLKEADAALYQAKDNGRNQVVWAPNSDIPCHNNDRHNPDASGRDV